MKRTAIGIGLLGALLLNGCSTMAPKQSRPDGPVPAAWPAGDAYKASGDGKIAADTPWNDYFDSGRLKKTIALALEQNRDLRVSALNIERARALYQIQDAAIYPTVSVGATAGSQRTLGELPSSEMYAANVGLSSYEIDFFGRIRSLRGKALEEFLATEQARRSVQMSLVAEVANAWLSLAADQERLRLAKETLELNLKSYGLTKSRMDAGVSSELALRQAQTTVESARVDIARFTTIVAQDRNALDLLAGAPVPAELLPTELDAVAAVKELSAGIPSEVLQRRPDILEAENRLRAANANIGAARAAFFPRISLTTSIGLGSTELSGLFSGAAWAFLPRLDLPIYDGGARKANLKVAEVDKDIFVARYEKAIQVAFREVADALAVRGTIEDQLTAQQALVDASAASKKLSEARYEKGVDNYLTVLDSQRSLYQAQQNLISLRLTKIANTVTLYKVLGGGA